MVSLGRRVQEASRALGMPSVGGKVRLPLSSGLHRGRVDLPAGGLLSPGGLAMPPMPVGFGAPHPPQTPGGICALILGE